MCAVCDGHRVAKCCEKSQIAGKVAVLTHFEARSTHLDMTNLPMLSTTQLSFRVSLRVCGKLPPTTSDLTCTFALCSDLVSATFSPTRNSPKCFVLPHPAQLSNEGAMFAHLAPQSASLIVPQIAATQNRLQGRSVALHRICIPWNVIRQ